MEFVYETASSYKSRICQNIKSVLEQANNSYDTCLCAGLLTALDIIESTEPDVYPLQGVK